MASVANLCNQGLILKNGNIALNGNIEDAIRQYQISSQSAGAELDNYKRKGTGTCRINKINIVNENGIQSNMQRLGDKMMVEVTLINFARKQLDKIRIIIGVYNPNDEGYLRFDSMTSGELIKIAEDGCKITCKIEEHLNIKPDQYTMNIAIFNGDELVDYVSGVGKFFIENFDYYGSGQSVQSPELSKVFYRHSWITS